MKKEKNKVEATAPENENKSLQAMIEKTLGQTTLSEKLKNHQIYLNNIVHDNYFIEMSEEENLSQYLYEFDSQTNDIEELGEYIETVESMFIKNEVPIILFANLDDAMIAAFKEGALDYFDGIAIKYCHYDEYNLNIRQAWCAGWQYEHAKKQAMLN